MSTRNVRTVVALLLLTTAAGLVVATLAADPPAAKVDPRAQKVLDDFAAMCRGMQGFEVDAHADTVIEQLGKRQQVEATQHMQAARPNMLNIVTDGPTGSLAVSNGKELVIAVASLDAYAVTTAPPTWAEIAQDPVFTALTNASNAALVPQQILSGEYFEGLVKMSVVEYLGLEKVDGDECHHLNFVNEQMDLELWVQTGKQPLVRKVVPNLQKAIERTIKAQAGNNAVPQIKITCTIDYKNWKIDPTFPPNAFVFTAPDGAKRVDSLDELAGRRPEGNPKELLGKPAPPVRLDLVDGGKFDLASMKNENIVILDFWATWCGPCIQAMPVIEKVAERFRAQGVRLFAVNLMEGTEQVKKFLEDTKLKVVVPMDLNGAVAAAYKATAIPQTVIIGRDGTVQAVHVGLSESLEGQLTSELEALIEGKSLAAEPTK